MKLISLVLLMALLSCGKSSSTKNTSQVGRNPVKAPVRWTIESNLRQSENLLISITDIEDDLVTTITIIDTCRGDEVETRGMRSGKNQIIFDYNKKLNPVTMPRIRIVDLGEDCMQNHLLYSGHIPRLTVTYDSRKDTHVNQKLELTP